jgi:predicted peptidase
MYLHGGSLRGHDVERLRTSGLPQIVDQDTSFPFIVVSLLCPAGEIWTDTDLLVGILDKVMSQYAVDSERIYLTGHSMGGRGALYLAYKYPDRFSAIVAMSPYSTITAWAQRLKSIPIWIIHGAKDELVPVGESETMVKALKDVGGDVKFTILAERDHFILDNYENKQLYKWLFEHRKKR